MCLVLALSKRTDELQEAAGLNLAFDAADHGSRMLMTISTIFVSKDGRVFSEMLRDFSRSGILQRPNEWVVGDEEREPRRAHGRAVRCVRYRRCAIALTLRSSLPRDTTNINLHSHALTNVLKRLLKEKTMFIVTCSKGREPAGWPATETPAISHRTS